jgi:hypothetical protein
MLAWGKDAHSPSKVRSATGRIETTDTCAADKCVHTAEENTACSSELIAKTYKIQCRSGKARHSASSSGRLFSALVASRTQQSATKEEGDPYKPIPEDYSTLSSFQKTQTKKAESSRETKHRTENRTCYRSTIPTQSTNTKRELNISDRNQFRLRR